MKNSFLQELAADVLSNESVDLVEPTGTNDADVQQELIELLEANVDATVDSMESVCGLIQALESNFNHHFDGKDVSFESYKNYEQTTALILKAHGLDVPVAVACPSFEADNAEVTKEKAEEKKENVVKRAGKYLMDLIRKLVAWVKGLFSKKGEATVKQAEEVAKEAEDLAEELKKPEGEPKPSTESAEVKTYQHMSSESFKEFVGVAKYFKDVVGDSEKCFNLFRTINEDNKADVIKEISEINARYDATFRDFIEKYSGLSKVATTYEYDRLKAARHVEEVKLVAETTVKLLRDSNAWLKTVSDRWEAMDEKRLELIAGPAAGKIAKEQLAEIPKKIEALARLINFAGIRTIKQIRAAM